MVARFHDGNRVPLSLAVLKALAGDGNLILNFGVLGDQKVIIQNPNGETEREFPINEHGQMLVNFRGPEGTFPHYLLHRHSQSSRSSLGPARQDCAGRRDGARTRATASTPPRRGISRASRFMPTRSTTSSQNDVILRSANNDIEGLCGIAARSADGAGGLVSAGESDRDGGGDARCFVHADRAPDAVARSSADRDRISAR